MLALAWRKDADNLRRAARPSSRWSRSPFLTSSIPATGRKAHELAVIAREGRYEENGERGPVQHHRGHDRIQRARARALLGATRMATFRYCRRSGRSVGQGRRRRAEGLPYPGRSSARRLDFEGVPEAGPWLPEVKEAFNEHLAEMPRPTSGPFCWPVYGNLIRNRVELGIASTDDDGG